jgi:hypothetical protein
MDLALEFGIDVETLKRTMSERSVRRWNRYALRKLLPQRRLEMYLAQIALVIRTTCGDGKKRYTLSDFLFKEQILDDDEDDDDDVDDLEATKEAFGFKPNAGVTLKNG